ncbi:MAG: MBL fold metallo-hydrolase [Pseudomonadota bacterium]
MTPVFANSAFVPAREFLLIKGGRFETVRLRVRYGVLFHPTKGPILIDTGYTVDAVGAPERVLALKFYGAALGPQLNDAEQPAAMLGQFGFEPNDVRYVIITHFHADHVSGLSLFPHARFIADERAYSRLKAASAWQNLRHGVFPSLLPADFEERLDGLAGRARIGGPAGVLEGFDLFGDGSMAAIPLPGHADGHFGILFPNLEPKLLYAVDSQWLMSVIVGDQDPALPVRLIAADYQALRDTSDVLRAFMAEGGDIVLCHDPSVTAYDLPSGGKTE